MKMRSSRTQMSLVRMARLFVLRCMRLGLDAVLADMASFPRTEGEEFAH